MKYWINWGMLFWEEIFDFDKVGFTEQPSFFYNQRVFLSIHKKIKCFPDLEKRQKSIPEDFFQVHDQEL